MWWFLIGLILVGIYQLWASQHEKQWEEREARARKERERERLSDPAIAKSQAEFETYLNGDFLPEGICPRDVYIYRQLMRGWYSKLAAKPRYDEPKSESIRC